MGLYCAIMMKNYVYYIVLNSCPLLTLSSMVYSVGVILLIVVFLVILSCLEGTSFIISC